MQTLLNSITEYWTKEAKDQLDIDEDFDPSVFGTMEHEWQFTIKKPKRSDRKFKLSEEYNKEINQMSIDRFNKSSKDLVTKNIYKDQYSLPRNLEFREPDIWVKKAVQDSYVAKRTLLLQKYSIDPNLGKYN